VQLGLTSSVTVVTDIVVRRLTTSCRRLSRSGLIFILEFQFPLTQRELADLLGLSAVHVNRTLQILRGQNLVELNHRRLKVCNRVGLYEVAEFDPRYLKWPAFSAGGAI